MARSSRVILRGFRRMMGGQNFFSTPEYLGGGGGAEHGGRPRNVPACNQVSGVGGAAAPRTLRGGYLGNKDAGCLL